MAARARLDLESPGACEPDGFHDLCLRLGSHDERGVSLRLQRVVAAPAEFLVALVAAAENAGLERRGAHVQRAPSDVSRSSYETPRAPCAARKSAAFAISAHVDSRLGRNAVGGEPRGGLGRVDRSVDGEHARVDPLAAQLLRRRQRHRAHRVVRRGPEARARSGMEGGRVRDLHERASAVGPQRSRADREEEERLSRHVRAPALEALHGRVGDRAAAPDVARSHARDRDGVDDGVQPAQGIGRIRERALELVGGEDVAANSVSPAAPDGV